MAGATGLEPAASAVTGQRSNQLSYAPNQRKETLPQSNPRVNEKIGLAARSFAKSPQQDCSGETCAIRRFVGKGAAR